ncbi:M protein trans-acting positive regulator (MGA), partial [Clostridium perfringens]|nr:M protein trans-acting positive regulator (MGA) [Clostridium perfringens]
MFKENLLDISEKIQIEILKKLYLNNGTFCKYNLCSDLNISFPTLKLYIKNINLMFLKNYNNTINIFIDKENLILKSDIDISLDNFI